jgi:hypothetical protein
VAGEPNHDESSYLDIGLAVATVWRRSDGSMKWTGAGIGLVEGTTPTPEAAKLAVETALAGVLLSALARLSYPAIKEAQLPQGNKTEHDPKMAASAVMIALVKMRCQRYLRHAIEDVRAYRERPSCVTLVRAATSCGHALGQASVLYDTPAVAWRYLRAVQKIQAVITKLSQERDVIDAMGAVLEAVKETP